MKYVSVCSGIECVSVAVEPLGWEPQWFSEIEPAPCRHLKVVYPHVPNLGDMTKVFDNEIFKKSDFDVLFGGTPCQSFSLAGLRQGLDSKNGNLAFAFCRILYEKRPTWFVWENVPGVFSSYSGGKNRKLHPRKFRHRVRTGKAYTETADFAQILNAFRECGYSCAWRVLDSQNFGVPQRRRRVFVVGHLGNDWRPPAAVLFERESLRRDFTPRRGPGQETAGTLDSRTKGGGFPGTDGAASGHIVAGTLDASAGRTRGAGINPGNIVTATIDANYGRLQGASGQDANHGHSTLVVDKMQVFGGNNTAGPLSVNPALSTAQKRLDFETNGFVVQSVEPTPFDTTQMTSKTNRSNPQPGDPCHTLTKGAHAPAILLPGTFVERAGSGHGGKGILIQDDQASTLQAQHVQKCFYIDVVRRLTPLECERLQGLPDGYTHRAGLSDTARYSAIGNGMTVQVIRWLGERIEKVQSVLNELES